MRKVCKNMRAAFGRPHKGGGRLRHPPPLWSCFCIFPYLRVWICMFLWAPPLGLVAQVYCIEGKELTFQKMVCKIDISNFWLFFEMSMSFSENKKRQKQAQIELPEPKLCQYEPEGGKSDMAHLSRPFSPKWIFPKFWKFPKFWNFRIFFIFFKILEKL